MNPVEISKDIRRFDLMMGRDNPRRSNHIPYLPTMEIETIRNGVRTEVKTPYLKQEYVDREGIVRAVLYIYNKGGVPCIVGDARYCGKEYGCAGIGLPIQAWKVALNKAFEEADLKIDQGEDPDDVMARVNARAWEFAHESLPAGLA